MSQADFGSKLNQLKLAGFFDSLEINRGIEKESLRVNAEGKIASTRHPQALGSPLTNPSITTDFAESLIELVTPVFQDIDDLYEYLLMLHVFVNQHLNDEVLWAYSMPPSIDDEDSINIAQYSDTNAGKIKEIYRRGLKERYGSSMQCIAGIHFNFSLGSNSLKQLENNSNQENIDEIYLGLIRNFKRYYWFVLSVFGASPVVDKTFLKGRDHDLDVLGEKNFYKPFATSLRMSDIGYKSFAQKDMDIRYDSLDEFLQKIKDAILIPFKPFEDIGLKKNSEWLQISTGRLQIENEYYDSIRPKRVGNKDLRPYEVLLSSGIEYVEVRGIDLSPNEPVGISKDQVRLLDLILIYCIILDSPLINNAEAKKIKQNESAVISNGNNSEATIFFNDKKQFIGTAKQKIVEKLKMLASVMPNSSKYVNALKSVENKNGIIDSLNDGEIAFTDYGMLTSKLHKSYLSSLEYSDLEKFKDEAKESLKNFDKLNTLKEPSIDEFINSYNSKL